PDGIVADRAAARGGRSTRRGSLQTERVGIGAGDTEEATQAGYLHRVAPTQRLGNDGRRAGRNRHAVALRNLHSLTVTPELDLLIGHDPPPMIGTRIDDGTPPVNCSGRAPQPYGAVSRRAARAARAARCGLDVPLNGTSACWT